MSPHLLSLWYAPKEIGLFRESDWDHYRYAKYYLYR